LKTGELIGLREVPATTLASRGSDELLAFTGEQRDWKLTLTAEKLAARVIAEVFGLITVGDGLVGGSATIRYGIFNQGVQEFRVVLPAHWKNVEFTGPNIRRKEQVASTDTNVVVWNIALQDKAWGGYTLVVTYDYQFDPKSALLDFAGAHALGVERETGSLGVMSGAGLKLEPKPFSEPLRRVDESELTETDRALATRSLLLAFKYTGTNYALAVEVTRFEQIAGLDAIADRTELTTVLTEAGQMLTQAAFMVKNNDKQFQRFKLPSGAEFWSSYVNGQPAKPERDGDWLLVPLPRQADRDQAFAVDIVYAQKINLAKSRLPQRIDLQAPLTDVPNTYAEWQLFAPMSQRLGGFGGNMMVAPYTTYELRDAWREFVQFWGNAVDRNLGGILFAAVIAVFVALGFIAVRRGARAFVSAVVVLAILAVLTSMLLPALSKAKAKAQRISAVNNLKQIALAARLYANDRDTHFFPNSFEDMRAELGNEKVLIDPSTGQRFTWIGAGKTDDGAPDAVLAYSRSENSGVIALADGSVHQVSADRLEQMLRADQMRVAGVAVAAQPSRISVSGQTPSAPQVRFGHGPVDAGGLPVLGAATASPGREFAQTSGIIVTNAIAAKVMGIRPIRIDIPKIGRAFTFTKVLNVGNEPLAVRASVMKLATFRVFQTTWQTAAFLIGLTLIWLLSHRAQRSTFWLTVACALVIVAVAGMLLTWRALHLVLIALPPLLIVSALGLLIWKFVPRKTAADIIPPIEPEGTLPTAVTLIALTLFLWHTNAGAAERSSWRDRCSRNRSRLSLRITPAPCVRRSRSSTPRCNCPSWARMKPWRSSAMTWRFSTSKSLAATRRSCAKAGAWACCSRTRARRNCGSSSWPKWAAMSRGGDWLSRFRQRSRARSTWSSTKPKQTWIFPPPSHSRARTWISKRASPQCLARQTVWR
jgi:type II secretory pathway pseudopilin PulG